MAEANNLENKVSRSPEGITKAVNNFDNELKRSRHLRKIVMGITVGVVTVCSAGMVYYFGPKILEEIQIKNNHLYCQHIKAELGREYHLERYRFHNSKYNCLEIEQMYKQLTKK